MPVTKCKTASVAKRATIVCTKRYMQSKLCFQKLINMNNNEIFYIEDCGMSLDGGSIFINGKLENDQKIEIFLPQNKIPENFNKEFIPGKLYFNHKLIEPRSALETKIIYKLSNCMIIPKNNTNSDKVISKKSIILGKEVNDYFTAIEQGPEFATLFLINSLIKFVESKDYELKT